MPLILVRMSLILMRMTLLKSSDLTFYSLSTPFYYYWKESERSTMQEKDPKDKHHWKLLLQLSSWNYSLA
jgi:hypothetical protein